MNLLWIFSALVALVLVWHFSTLLQLARLRRKGLYPQAGQATQADVECLLQSGRSALAIRCYREIHGCSLRQAKDAVEAMRSSRT